MQNSMLTYAEWHDIYWAKDGTELIGQMSSSIFVGDHLASNAEWQKTSISYAINMFQGARALRTWPAWTRPLIHWFIPECNVCRAEVKKADSLIQAELQRRSMSGGRYDDTITWMHQAAKGRPYNATANQLGLSMAAVVTTSELLKQCLVELCPSSVLNAPLREEIEQAISQHGWTGAALAQMQLMDSIIKETQRLNPLSEGKISKEKM
jgi:cytochrome P450